MAEVCFGGSQPGLAVGLPRSPTMRLRMKLYSHWNPMHVNLRGYDPWSFAPAPFCGNVDYLVVCEFVNMIALFCF